MSRPLRLLAGLGALALVAALAVGCGLVPHNGTPHAVVNYRLNLLNLALDVVVTVALAWFGWQARRTYLALRGDLTSLGAAGRKVQELVEQGTALLAQNEELAERSRAAEAETQRVRLDYLQAMEERRRAADRADDPGADE